jgi:hypothetical protein
MGTRGTRSIFAAALCTGIAMVGLSVHGLMGIDGELEQSAFAAREAHYVEYQPVYEQPRDCRRAPADLSRT